MKRITVMLLAIVFIASAGVSHGKSRIYIEDGWYNWSEVEGFCYIFPDGKTCDPAPPVSYPDSVESMEPGMHGEVVMLYTSDCGNWVEPGILTIEIEGRSGFGVDWDCQEACDHEYTVEYSNYNHFYQVDYDPNIFTVDVSDPELSIVGRTKGSVFINAGHGTTEISIGLSGAAMDVDFLCANAIGAEVEIYHEQYSATWWIGAGMCNNEGGNATYCDCDTAGDVRATAEYDGDTTPVATFTIQINGNALSCCSAPPPPSGGGGGGGGGCSSIGISGSGSCGGDGSGGGTGPCGS